MLDKIYTYLINNPAVLIAFLSLVVSFLTFKKTSTKITHSFNKNIQFENKNNISISQEEKLAILGADCFITKLSIVNTTPFDISYFDLRAFDPETNLNCYLATENSLGAYKGIQLFHHTLDDILVLEIPKKNYGVLKAKSFTRLDLIVMKKTENTKKINISFRIPKKNFIFNDYYSVTNRSKFKTFGISYDLTKKIN